MASAKKPKLFTPVKDFQKKYPKAYLDGYQNFYGRDFFVSTDVLIPRPETEQLIDLALELFGQTKLPGVRPSRPKLSPQNSQILDVGTGSGCIALTLALELPSARIYATDISPSALKIADKNAKKFKIKNVTFSRRDLCNPEISSADQTSDNFPKQFDLILANLPYVDPTWPWLDRETLAAEPALALYANDNGLALIKTLLVQISTFNLLAPNAFLILEADPCQHNEIIHFASSHGFKLQKISGFSLLFS